MNQYLLNIAARSNGNVTNELLPSKQIFNAVDAGISEGFTEENNIQDSALQNQFVHQSIVPAPLIMPQKVQHADGLNKTETGMQERNIETSYLSKHIERVTPEEENTPAKIKAIETTSFKIDQASQITAIENAVLKPDVNEPAFADKTVSKIIPEKKATNKKSAEKNPDDVSEADNLSETSHADEIRSVIKQKINPAVEEEDRKKNKLPPTNSRIERIIPNQPSHVNKRPVQNNKANEAAPKLVIGKIIVEILPPKLPVPQKVITKVVQSPSKNSFSKSNKLSFGLGQM
jgi:hypothetical protein